MENPITKGQTASFLFTAAAGTFLHFLFDLTGASPLSALIAPVNESIWEHLELLYLPMLLAALWEYRRWGSVFPTFLCVKVKGIFLGMALIPAAYYLYTGILGINIDLINIAIFFLAALVVFRQETRWLLQGTACPLSRKAALVLLLLPAVLFVILTFCPPRIPLFRDPITGTYGFQ